MSESPEATKVQPEAKRGDAAWKEHRDAISDRNMEARKRGTAERKIALSRVNDQRRLNARREAEQLHAINAKLGKTRARG
jgi:hypothetical protein